MPRGTTTMDIRYLHLVGIISTYQYTIIQWDGFGSWA
jgi:hypothetical protein